MAQHDERGRQQHGRSSRHDMGDDFSGRERYEGGQRSSAGSNDGEGGGSDRSSGDIKRSGAFPASQENSSPVTKEKDKDSK